MEALCIYFSATVKVRRDEINRIDTELVSRRLAMTEILFMENNVFLRDVIDDDLPIFFEQQNDPIANEMAAFPARDRGAFMAHWHRVKENVKNLHKTIVYSGQVAGNMVSFDMEGHREVGYWLGREFWGKGIASKALAEFLSYETTRPLYGVVVKHNVGSRRVLEKCGFQVVREEGDEIFLLLDLRKSLLR